MDKEKFKLRLNIKSGKEDVDKYLNEIHDYVLSFDTSNIKKVILALDNLMGDISDDLNLISTGDTWVPDVTIEEVDGKKTTIEGYSKLKVLSDEASSKVFDRVMTLMTKVNDFKSVSQLAESLRPEIVDEIQDAKIKITDDENPFETVLNKVKGGNGK